MDIPYLTNRYSTANINRLGIYVPCGQYLHVPFQTTIFPGFIKRCHMNDWKISKLLGLTSPQLFKGTLIPPMPHCSMQRDLVSHLRPY